MTTRNRFGICLILLIAIGTIFNPSAKAQVADTIIFSPHPNINQSDKYTIWGAALGFFDVQDTKMSPMVYSGPGLGLEMSLLGIYPRFTNLTDFNMHYALLVGAPSTGSYMHGVAFRFNDALLFQLKPKQWKVGGSLDFQSRARIFPKIGNDAFGIDLFARLNLAGSYTINFKSRRANNTLDVYAELPLFASVMRFPDYSVDAVNFLFLPAGGFKALRTKFTLLRSFKYSNENRYAFSYEWDFFTFKEYDKLFKTVSGSHLLSYTFWLKTK